MQLETIGFMFIDVTSFKEILLDFYLETVTVYDLEILLFFLTVIQDSLQANVFIDTCIDVQKTQNHKGGVYMEASQPSL